MIEDDDVTIANKELARLRKLKSGNGTKPRIAGEKSPFICINEILALVPVSRGTLYNMIKEERFPRQKSIRGRAAVWSRKEIMDWISKKLA